MLTPEHVTRRLPELEAADCPSYTLKRSEHHSALIQRKLSDCRGYRQHFVPHSEHVALSLARSVAYNVALIGLYTQGTNCIVIGTNCVFKCYENIVSVKCSRFVSVYEASDHKIQKLNVILGTRL